jgi:phosphoserine aminotransferase
MDNETSQQVYNFSAGPAVLPDPVLRRAQQELPDWHGTGMSVMEMSHRGQDFVAIAEHAESRLRDLMAVPDDYRVLFLQGGATGQFAAVPMNLSTQEAAADYVITGNWSKRAHAEAARFLDRVNVAATASPSTYVPAQQDWQLTPGADYVHLTLTETIQGVRFAAVPDIGGTPLVADVSSIILSEPLEVSDFGVLYAGAQKNIGPSGLVVVIVAEDMLGRARPATPQVWNWFENAKAGSMINTPPTYSWYIAGLVFDWVAAQGGVAALAEVNRRKAAKLYGAIDASGCYANPVEPANRSLTNVPFGLARPDLEPVFLAEARRAGLVNLEGHRSVGGMRASIYNALPEAGVDALIEFMKEFEAKHG